MPTKNIYLDYIDEKQVERIVSYLSSNVTPETTRKTAHVIALTYEKKAARIRICGGDKWAVNVSYFFKSMSIIAPPEHLMWLQLAC